MEKSLFKIVLSELVLTTFVISNILPMSIYAEDVILGNTIQTGSVLETNETVESTWGVQERTTEVVTATWGNTDIVSDPLTSTGDVTENTTIETWTGEVISITNTGSTTSEWSGSITITETWSTEATPQTPATEKSIPVWETDEIVSNTDSTPRENKGKKDAISWSGQNYVEWEILIEFKDENIDLGTSLGQYQINNIEDSHALEMTSTIPGENIAVMSIADTNASQSLRSTTLSDITWESSIEKREALENIIDELKKDTRIKHVQKNFIYKTQATSPIVNDPEFNNLWGLHNEGQLIEGVSGEIDADIDYPEAMEYASWKLNTDVLVAVIDTGIAYNHPDISAAMWDGSHCVSDTGANLGGCIHGYDFANDDTDPFDGHSHGTHVSGTIGWVTNNSIWVAWVSPRVKFMAVKVLDDNGYGTTEDIIRGINFAKNNGAKVMNASLGMLTSVSKESDFDYVTYNAIGSFSWLFIAAAWNSGINFDYYSDLKNFPSWFWSDTIVSWEAVIDRELVLSGNVTISWLPNIISVAATDNSDNLAYFSNYGVSGADIWAPGVSILSSIVTQSGEMMPIQIENWWTKQVTASGNNWTTRPITTVSGEYVELTGALWWDTSNPYVLWESVYIERSFTGVEEGSNIDLTAWCDTPMTKFWYSDYLEVLVSTGWIYTPVQKIDEYTLYWNNLYSTWIDGYQWEYAKIRIYPNFSLSWNVDIRIKWKTGTNEHTPDEQHLGCLVDGIWISQSTPTYDYYAGTSMASPHVAWAAALAWSYKPSATAQEIKDAILNSGDYKYQLSNLVRSSSRLNIHRMLKALNAPKILSHKTTVKSNNSVKVDIEGEYLDSLYVMYSFNSGAWNTPTSSFDDFGYLLPYYQIGGNTLEKDTSMATIMISNYNESDNMEINWIQVKITPILTWSATFSGTVCLRDIWSNALCWESWATIPQAITQTWGTYTFDTTANYILWASQFWSEFPNYINYEIYIDNAPNWVTWDKIKFSLQSLDYSVAGNSVHLDTRNSPNSTIDIVRDGPWSTTTYYYTTYFASFELNKSGKYTSDIEDLLPDTLYYYKIEWCGVIVCDESIRNTIFTFRTPKTVEKVITSPITVSGEVYLNGSTATGVVFSGSTASGKITMINTGSTVTMALPTQWLIITSSGTWDGILRSPEVLSLTGTISLSGWSVAQVQSVMNIWGTGGVSLSLSGQLATITIAITGFNGSTLPIYRSPDSSIPYVQIGTCVVANNLCTFTTNHFSLFAVGTPVSTTPPTSPVSTVITGNGWGGGSYQTVWSTFTTSNSLYTPLQINYMQWRGTLMSMISNINNTLWTSLSNVINLFKRDGMKTFLLGLTYSEDEDPMEFAQAHITDPIIAYIEDSEYTRGQKLIMYDRVIATLDKQIKKQSGDAGKLLSLTLARKDVKKSRTLFIKLEFKK